jgi:hypothetical protein
MRQRAHLGTTNAPVPEKFSSTSGDAMVRTVQGLQKVEAAIGSWSPNDLAYVERLDYRSQLGEAATLDMTALFQKRGTCGWPDLDRKLFRVWMRFDGVQGLTLKGFSGGAMQVAGFDIHSMGDRGWETGNFEVEDYENGVIGFICSAVEVLRVEAASTRAE